MSYTLPTPPASGAVVDPDGIVWRLQGTDRWAATCQTCHTPLGPMSWTDLLKNKAPLEDAPATLAGEPA